MDAQEFAEKMKTVCLHGRVLTNPYTGRLIYVPCGICDACLARRATNNEMRVHAQEHASMYSYFITLSYNAKAVPTYRITLKERGKDTNIYTCTPCPRMSINRTVTMFPHNKVLRKRKQVPVAGLSPYQFDEFSFCATDKYVQEYHDKASLSNTSKVKNKYPQFEGLYGWLNWQDVSLFMKRLRKMIFKKLGYYEKIHTYIVGEYGPVTFRPHWHILLFFDSQKLSSCIGKLISACWYLGRVDWSASRGGAEQYVAGYCNSFSSLPYHIRDNRQVRSRARFSNGFGNDYFKRFVSAAREGNFTAFVDGAPCVVRGKSKTVYPWRSCLDSFFFRFASRDGVTCYELYRIVHAVCNVFRRPAFINCTDYAIVRKLYSYLYEELSPTGRVRFLQSDRILNEISDFLHLPFVNAPGEDYKNSFISRWYLLFHSVSIFLDNNEIDWMIYDSGMSRLWSLLQNSIDFYKYREQKSLENSLRDCEAAACNSAYILVRQTEEENRRFLDSFEGRLSQSFLSKHIWLNTKHRELNDVNGKFVTYGAL